MGLCIHRHSTRHTGDIVLGGTLPPVFADGCVAACSQTQLVGYQASALKPCWPPRRRLSPLDNEFCPPAYSQLFGQTRQSLYETSTRRKNRARHRQGRSSSRRRKPACAGYARTVITLLCNTASAFCVLCFLGSLHILAHRFVLRRATLVDVGWLFSLLGCLGGPAFTDLPWPVGTVPHTHLPIPILSRCKLWPAHPKLNTLPRSCVQGDCVLPSAAASKTAEYQPSLGLAAVHRHTPPSRTLRLSKPVPRVLARNTPSAGHANADLKGLRQAMLRPRTASSTPTSSQQTARSQARAPICVFTIAVFPLWQIGGREGCHHTRRGD